MKNINLGDLLEIALSEATKMLKATENADRIEATFTSKSPVEQKYMRGFMNNNPSMKASIDFMKCINGAIESAKLFSKMEGESVDPYPLINTVLDGLTEVDGRPFKITITKR